MSVIELGAGIANDMINDDVIQPFQLEISSLRGRLVRLGPVLDDILIPHDYPEVVSHLVAQSVTLSLLLSSMLKYDGIFTLQASGKGAITMVVSDVTTKGNVRACATFDPEAVKGLKPKSSLKDLMGEGYLAFTVDQGQDMERYQGIVELQGNSLLTSIEHYFSQSEQIGTGIKMAVGKPNKKNAGWRSGAIMLQHLPEEGGHLDNKDRKDMRHKEDSADMEEDWARANILLETCSEQEFLAPALDGNNLLVRLFHEEGVRIYTPTRVKKKCRCSTEKTEGVLRTLPEEDLRHIAKDGKISMNCEFCNRLFTFDLEGFI